ncbi:MAG: succinate dehydrogenase iron-sulfur subunit [Chloroflexi bacterium]|nr:succinate dehydrogenase iron-sulfur subunit [Chloroflexota bacterium]
MANKKAVFNVFRFDPDKEKEPHYDTFSVEVKVKMSVLEALFEILEKQDNTLAFRFSCRGAICGSCAMFISGKYRLACETLVEKLDPRGIEVAPLPHLRILKDLAVDMEPFYRKFDRIMPFFQEGKQKVEREYIQAIRERKEIDEITDCILCAACESACPLTWTSDYLGPAVLTKAYRFVADSREGATKERLSLVDGEDGVWRCHTIFNCVEACPKRINQTRAIEKLRKGLFARKLGFK